MEDKVDYLVLGSGLSSLSFSSLMAQKKHSIKILESHEFFGGYGHTFPVGEYRFNAQLHYVAGCGEGAIVNVLLKKLGLEKKVTFNRLNAEGYDRVYCGDKKLYIPYGYDKLQHNMEAICPESKAGIKKFIDILFDFQNAADCFPRHLSQSYQIAKALPSYWRLYKYRKSTLQDVFDKCELPKVLQTLVAGQLIDYMLPPKELSFLVWAALFNAYNNGAFYATHHYESFINAIVNSIQGNGGLLIPNERVVEFITEGNTVIGVYSQSVDPETGIASGPKKPHYGKNIICNFDPKVAAGMISPEKFSQKVSRALEYDYSPSSFVLYGVVKDLDLSRHGFGDWNIWHCQEDHNEAFRAMYHDADYSKPYFGMNCRSLHTSDQSNCNREGCQIFQICTVANYEYWKTLKIRDHKAYNLKKKEVLDCLLDTVEKHYVPDIKSHLALKMTGTPTTNERYVNSPMGGSYGVNLTPKNFQFSRKLTSHTSLNNFYFCSAASGAGGFSGTISTGIQLYEKLAKDYI
jgi:phytoene dehydrogenase-like protein